MTLGLLKNQGKINLISVSMISLLLHTQYLEQSLMKNIYRSNVLKMQDRRSKTL